MAPTRSQKTKRIRTAISNDIKKEICEYIKSNSNVKQGDVALFFNRKYNELNIDRSTVSKIWQNHEKWLAFLSNSQTSHTFRNRSVQFPELDKALQFWTSQAVAAGLPLTDLILQQKALELAKMLDIGEDKIQFSNGWIWRFKRRNGLRKINIQVKQIAYQSKVSLRNVQGYVQFWLSMTRRTFIMQMKQDYFFEWNLIKH